MKKILCLISIVFVIASCGSTKNKDDTTYQSGGDKYTTWTAVPSNNFSDIKYRVHCSYYGYFTGSYWEVQMKNESSTKYIKADAEIDSPVYNDSLFSGGLYQIRPSGFRNYIGNENVGSTFAGSTNCDVNYSAIIGVWEYNSSWVAIAGSSKTFEITNSTDSFLYALMDNSTNKDKVKSIETGIDENLPLQIKEKLNNERERYETHQKKY